jgi:hypothetical protein
MAKFTKLPKPEVPEGPQVSVGASELAAALTHAIEVARPQKKTVFSRKANTPWTPKDGSPKLKLKRKLYQHGLLLPEDRLTNAQIALANKLRPGEYCDGFVRVTRRRDKGINITYPVKTQSNRIELVVKHGVRSLDELFKTCIEQAAMPKPAVKYEEDED